MELDLQKLKYDQGAYGIVIFSMDKNFAYKIYKNDKRKYRVKRTFDSEVDAYKIAMESSELKKYTPEYFGTENITKILSCSGIDITSQFYCNYNLKLSFINGKFEKMHHMNATNKETVKKLFTDSGIRYLRDASAVINDQGEIFKVVDFATLEFESWIDTTPNNIVPYY